MCDKDMMVQFFNSMNNRDLEQMGAFLTQSTEFYFPKSKAIIGRERILRFFKILFHKYPELAFQIQRVIIQGHQAAIHWTNRGINRKGEPYKNEGVTILEIEGGKISFLSDFFKDTEKF